MSLLTLHETDGYRSFDEVECREAGKTLNEAYRAARPFPHVMIEDFIDADMLRSVGAAFPPRDGKAYFDRDQERLKFQFSPQESTSGLVRNLLFELNNRPFLGFLNELTGIDGLIPDPYFAGGGLHETRAGGHLGIHADFNVHREMKVERRLNLLIYLNDDWRPDYGGELELWDREMKGCVERIAPTIGRAVVFDTSLDSFHGHPSPLACPPDRSRRSIATYYYTAPDEGIAALPSRTTNFRARPGTGDRPDRRIAFDHFVRDWVPPRLQNVVRRFNRFK